MPNNYSDREILLSASGRSASPSTHTKGESMLKHLPGGKGRKSLNQWSETKELLIKERLAAFRIDGARKAFNEGR
jgi:hypothetical protein